MAFWKWGFGIPGDLLGMISFLFVMLGAGVSARGLFSQSKFMFLILGCWIAFPGIFMFGGMALLAEPFVTIVNNVWGAILIFALWILGFIPLFKVELEKPQLTSQVELKDLLDNEIR